MLTTLVSLSANPRVKAAADAEDAPVEALVDLARHVFVELEAADASFAPALAGQGACERTLAVAESEKTDAARGTAALRKAIGMTEENSSDNLQFTVWVRAAL